MTASLVDDRDVTAEVASSDTTVLTLKNLSAGGKEWRLTLHPEHLALASSGEAQPYVILRQQVMKSAAFAEGVRAFVLKQPFKATFKLTKEGTTALAEWIGKPVLARYYLKTRYSLVLPAAVLWMIGSIPLPANDAAGVAATPSDPFGLALGFLLAGLWACAKWRPHPLLFLLDSIWFLAMGAHLMFSVISGRSSQGWLVLVPLLLWMVAKGVIYFRRFSSTSIPKTVS